MRLLTVDLPAEHTVVLGGDWHVGNRSCSHDTISAQIKRVRDSKNTYFAHLGDVAEKTPVDHKHFSVDQLVPPPGWDKPLVTATDQYDYAERELFPQVADKTIVCLEGNHDFRFNNSAGNQLAAMLGRLNIPFGTYMCKVQVTVEGEPAYKMLLWHGWSGLSGQRNPDPMVRRHQMQKSLKTKLASLASDCEIMAMGHTHQLVVTEPIGHTVFGDDRNDLLAVYRTLPKMKIPAGNGKWLDYVPPESRWYVNTGSTLKGYEVDEANPYSTYSEKWGLPPADLGWAEVSYSKGQGLNVKPIYRTKA